LIGGTGDNLFTIQGFALAQTDLKKMIANSSISHMGYVILGLAVLTQVGFHGALLVMLAHGLYSGLLFSMVGLVYDRTHTREVGAMSGLAIAWRRALARSRAAWLLGLNL